MKTFIQYLTEAEDLSSLTLDNLLKRYLPRSHLAKFNGKNQVVDFFNLLWKHYLYQWIRSNLKFPNTNINAISSKTPLASQENFQCFARISRKTISEDWVTTLDIYIEKEVSEEVDSIGYQITSDVNEQLATHISKHLMLELISKEDYNVIIRQKEYTIFSFRFRNLFEDYYDKVFIKGVLILEKLEQLSDIKFNFNARQIKISYSGEHSHSINILNLPKEVKNAKVEDYFKKLKFDVMYWEYDSKHSMFKLDPEF